MPTQIEQIKSLHAGSDGWHVQYPWFSLGQLINANNEKGSSIFWTVAQKTTIYFNNAQRLHYLLHEPPINKSGWLRKYNIGVVTDEQDIPQQVQTKLPKHTSPEIRLEQEIIQEIDIAETAAETNNIAAIVPIVAIDKKELEEKELVKERAELSGLPQKVDSKEVFKIDLTKDTDNEENDVDEIDEGENELPEIEADKRELRIRSVFDNPQSPSPNIFEPYHTIDYFASLGIKIDLKALDDKLGKQLKSFTSWLKTMKRLPAQVDGQETDNMVVKADHSLENSDVVTEAMAEVLIKQGKNEQAIEILQKLSLLYPEKNHYFVIQIEQLKN